MNKLFRFFMFLSIPLMTVFAVSCSDDDGDDPQPASPSITSVSPEEALPGASVTIAGTNLADAEVTFGSTAATVSANTATSITTAVPEGLAAGSQNITVTTANGSDTHSFTVLEETVDPDPTTITSFDPEEGAVGDEITITGTNFDADNILTILIGEVEVTDFEVVDESTITFTVPEGAETGAVTINMIQGDPVVSETDFTVAGTGGNDANLYSGVVIHAQGARMDEGIHTVFNVVTGTTHHYEEPVGDEELARSVDFLMFDPGGDNNYAIMEPSPQGDASWLGNNFYKEIEWPHTNATMLRVLEDADEAFFEDADAETIAALPIGEDEEDHSGRINGIEVGDVILFESEAGRKGLIYFSGVEQDTEEDYKNDIFTVDVKVMDITEEGDGE